MDAKTLSTAHCTITNDALAMVRDTQGNYFSRLQKISPEKFAADTLNPKRAEEAAAVLEEYVELNGKKILEIGAGCGINHIVWVNKFGVDGWGIEPAEEGFEHSNVIAKNLLIANSLDPSRIIDAAGEDLPFSEGMFDIVYSSNVLEHVTDPRSVMREALRVLKPGGILQIICPNYLSYFDGHYVAFHPPVLWKGLFVWWIKWVYRRETAFAKTIRTEVNAVWVERQLATLQKETPLKVLGLGREKFIERMDAAEVNPWMGLGVIARLLRVAKHLRLNRIIGRLIGVLRGWTPLIITVRKEEQGQSSE